jgi:hypothetical protein
VPFGGWLGVPWGKAGGPYGKEQGGPFDERPGGLLSNGWEAIW